MFRFCAIDFETTGSVPGFPNEPWQLGLVAADGRGSVAGGERMESLLRVSSDRPFNKWAPGRHAALRSEISRAPLLSDLMPGLARFLALPVVAHNAGTERAMIAAALPLHVPALWIDTLALSRRAWPSAPSHALEDLVPALGLLPEVRQLCPGRTFHDALFDAFACALLLERMLSAPGWASMQPQDLARISGVSGIRP